jgi:NAD(P)H-hydrate epimerase
MIVLSPEHMKRLDEYAITTWGIPSTVLMENAGRTTYRLLKENYLRGLKKVVVFCGRGNNGGDGFVIARYALRDGFETTVFLLSDPAGLKGDALLNMQLYRSLGGNVVIPEGSAGKMREAADSGEVIVDAIFGTGLAKDVEGTEKAAIEAINLSGKPVIAVDIPSGIDGLTGVPLGAAVNADHTYTYGFPKFGHLLHPGASYRGRLTVVDISLPCTAQAEIRVDTRVATGEMIRAFYRSRPPEAHKGMFGNLAVIAGSTGKTGAAALAANAALAAGAGLVTLIVPSSLNPIMAVKLTEAMTYPVDDDGKGYFLLSSFDAVRTFIEDKDVVIMGPGLGRAEETMALVRKLYAETDKPLVIDADGINAFDGHAGLIKERGEKAIFTPHPGEFGRLTGMSPKQVNADRLNLGRRFAQDHGVTLVLKGAPTVTFSPDSRACLNPTGNAALAKGGAGDVLTGFIGGLVSQGYSAIEASLLGVYLHGYIADTWIKQHADMALVAGDLISGLSTAMRDIINGTDRIYIEKSL